MEVELVAELGRATVREGAERGERGVEEAIWARERGCLGASMET